MGFRLKPTTKNKQWKRNPNLSAKPPKNGGKVLTPEQYRILREAGTEPPNGKVYQEFKHHGAGTYFLRRLRHRTVFLQRKIRFQVRMALLYDPSKSKNEQLPLIGTGYLRTEVSAAQVRWALGARLYW